MSKSIYEEVLEEISEQKKAWSVSLRSIVPSKLDMIVNAIEQAQKQEKLLKLYKELTTVKEDMLSCCEVVDDGYYDFRDIEIYTERLIKELENE